MWQSLASLPAPLSEQPRVGVGGRGMRVILAFLAMKVAPGIAPAAAAMALSRVDGRRPSAQNSSMLVRASGTAEWQHS